MTVHIGDTPEQLNVKCGNWVDVIVVEGKCYDSAAVAELVAHIAALSSKVEIIENKLAEVADLLDVDGMTAVQWLLDNCPDMESLINSDPDECLRQIKADAGRAGCLYGIRLRSKGPCNDFGAAADSYAARVKAGTL